MDRWFEKLREKKIENSAAKTNVQECIKLPVINSKGLSACVKE